MEFLSELKNIFKSQENRRIIAFSLLLITLFGLLSIANVQGSSNIFTLTEIDPTGNNYAGHWQYEARTNSPQDTITSRQDSPWHWRHYDPTDTGKEHIKCDDIQYLYPANPASPDTAVSANGQTVTVNIYQAQDSVYVCFALECDDGTYSFALMRNLQTEKTITSGPCGGTAGTSGTPTTNKNPPVVEEEEEEEEEEATTTTTTNPLVPPADPITTDPPKTNDNPETDDNPPQTNTPPATNNDPPQTNNDPPETNNNLPKTNNDPPPEVVIPKNEITDEDNSGTDSGGETQQQSSSQQQKTLWK